MGNDRYDAVIVGAGPAGASAALLLAQNNSSVALIERGKKPGSKNMFGGSIYRKPTAKIIPGFWEKAPLERSIVTDELWLMDKNSAVKVGFTGLKFNEPPYNKFSAIRSKFDAWFANKAVEAGANLMTETLVDDLVYEKIGLLKKKVNGVKLDNGEIIYADVVLIAEGASANLTQKAGMRGRIEASSLTLYVKEELALPPEIIEARFNLEPGEGANLGMIGYPTSGVIGKGGLWTNKKSISLITGGYLNQINAKGISPYQLLSRFKKHPLIKRLIAGAESIAYKAHVIPKGGYENVPQLYDDGLLIAGDAAMMISGRRGSDIAMLTGLYAAETIAQARAAEDYSAKVLKGYEKRVMDSFFMKSIKKSKSAKKYYKDHPDADYLLTKAANDAAYRFFEVGVEPSEQKIKKIKKEILNMEPTKKLITDLYYGFKDWGIF
ncbi:FAD-dependent oxidoreductase [Selenihalanaerobacter shriftii]|uniref:Electron transfer flavoprotein-quinone oxidoreductase n=1 Tax=Selenihalanaerobacter shriftii TaxID=142842 RepID=A0A1T4P9V8_9FIRM|nr:FAD-dependent oxidoreductase [Selenihalanaerobacter shriftii]SJZ88026.1 electron transfer flavoprotein-quinone oxidoreductase [Selenihalanaerobacter shriftii]